MPPYCKLILLTLCGTVLLWGFSSERVSAEHNASISQESNDDKANEVAKGKRNFIPLSPTAAEAAGIHVGTAEIGRMGETLRLPAEVRYDPDRVANISPQMTGIIRDLYATEGDSVKKGERLARVSSRELADMMAAYISAIAAEKLARLEVEREEILWKDKITSRAKLQSARAAFSLAKAALQAAGTKLQVVGINSNALSKQLSSSDALIAEYLIEAPIAGVIIKRSVTLGETVSSGDAEAAPLFVIADESVVWIDITIFKQDLARVSVGTSVLIAGDDGGILAKGDISFISPIVDEASRTSTARMIIDNRKKVFRPGQFVRAKLNLGESVSVLRIPKNAVQIIESTPSVFVPTDGGYKHLPIVTGIEQDGYVAIKRGLSKGDKFVIKGGFTLKSQLEKDAFGADDD